MAQRIAYYVSSHGFGHAARQQAIIKQLAHEGIEVYVRSAAPPKFFRHATDQHQQQYDIGMIQLDALHFDVEGSLKAMSDLMATQEKLIQAELEFCRRTAIDLILSDMPPIAMEIAWRLMVPSMAITHFTWDWVYDHYTDDFPAYRYLVKDIRKSYRKATMALQVQHPLPHEFDMFKQVEPIPLIHNRPTQTRDEVRAMLDIHDDRPLILLSMGGHTWGDGNITALKQMTDMIFLVMPSTWQQVSDTPEQFRVVPTMLEDYHNVIAAADVIIGKAGGSTVAEVLAYRTPMIYTTQKNWREAQLLHDTMQQFASCLYVPVDDFEAGGWIPQLEAFLQRDHTWVDIPTNGVEVAMGWIRDWLNA